MGLRDLQQSQASQNPLCPLGLLVALVIPGGPTKVLQKNFKDMKSGNTDSFMNVFPKDECFSFHWQAGGISAFENRDKINTLTPLSPGSPGGPCSPFGK